MNLIKISVAVVFSLFLCGCETKLGGFLTEKTKHEQQIALLQDKHQKEIDAKVGELEKAKQLAIEAKEKQIVAGSNAFYAADLTFKSILAPTRTDVITNNYVIEGWTALGKRVPDAETAAKIIERLKTELDEKNTSLAQLKAVHDAKALEAQKIADEAKSLQDEVARLKDDLQKTQLAHNKELSQEKDKVIELDRKIISLEKERADDREMIAKTKTKFSMIAGGVALACLALSLWSPVFKREFGLGAVIMGIVAVGILYIQPWHVAVAAGVGILILVVRAAYKHNLERNTATDVYRAIESIKGEARGSYEALIKPKLEEWISKYDKLGKRTPNRVAENHIDARLREVGDK